MPKLAGELYCSALEQINQYALHVTSTHAYALLRWYQLQCVGGISVPSFGKMTEGINQPKRQPRLVAGILGRNSRPASFKRSKIARRRLNTRKMQRYKRVR